MTCAVETCADARDMDAVHLASHPSSGPPASDSWPRGAEPPVRSPLARSANRPPPLLRQPHASPTWKGAARTPLRLLRLSGRSRFPAIPASALRAVTPPCVRPPAPASSAPSPAPASADPEQMPALCSTCAQDGRAAIPLRARVYLTCAAGGAAGGRRNHPRGRPSRLPGPGGAQPPRALAVPALRQPERSGAYAVMSVSSCVCWPPDALPAAPALALRVVPRPVSAMLPPRLLRRRLRPRPPPARRARCSRSCV